MSPTPMPMAGTTSDEAARLAGMGTQLHDQQPAGGEARAHRVCHPADRRRGVAGTADHVDASVMKHGIAAAKRDETPTEQIRHLRELIDALDRRVPRIERSGEIRIARDAAELREKALKRIASLESRGELKPARTTS